MSSQFDRDYKLIRDCFLISLIPTPVLVVLSIIGFLFALGMFGPAMTYDNFGFVKDLFHAIIFDVIGNFLFIMSIPFRLLFGMPV